MCHPNENGYKEHPDNVLQCQKRHLSTIKTYEWAVRIGQLSRAFWLIYVVIDVIDRKQAKIKLKFIISFAVEVE